MNGFCWLDFQKCTHSITSYGGILLSYPIEKFLLWYCYLWCKFQCMLWKKCAAIQHDRRLSSFWSHSPLFDSAKVSSYNWQAGFCGVTFLRFKPHWLFKSKLWLLPKTALADLIYFSLNKIGYFYSPIFCPHLTDCCIWVHEPLVPFKQGLF